MEKELFKSNRHSTLFKEGNTLFKIYDSDIISDKVFDVDSFKLMDQIIYNQSLNSKSIRNVILPKELLFKKGTIFEGYTMPYVPSINVFEFLNKDNIPNELKFKYVEDLTNALREIHEYLIVGDIHLSNTLLGKNGAYLTDFDFSVNSSSSEEPICKYHIDSDEKLPIDESRTTDINKLFIVILSILYGYNFEKKVIYNSWTTNKSIIEILKQINAPDALVDYAFHMLVNEENPEFDDYFEIPQNEIFKKELERSQSILKRVKKNN